MTMETTRRAWAERDRYVCAECSAFLLGRAVYGGKVRPSMGVGWVKDDEGIYTMSKRSRAKMMEGKRPTYRRQAPEGPGNPRGTYVINPITIRCWRCDLVQLLEP